MHARSRIVLLGLALLAMAPPALAADRPASSDCGNPAASHPVALNVHTIASEDYPLLSIALGEEGRVNLDILIDEQGKVSDAKVAKSSGFARLDDAAVAIVQARWTYTPAMLAGKPIACPWKVAVNWHLTDFSAEALQNAPVTIVAMTAADYPADARARGEAGFTGVYLIANENGKIVFATVAHSSGFADLDAAALAIAQNRWRVTPAQLSGKPVKTTIGLVFVWSLEDKAKP